MTESSLACDETTELTKAGQTRAVSGVVERADLSPRGKGEGGRKSQDGGEGVKTAKPKECFCCVTSSHCKSEYKNLSAVVNQKFAQRGTTYRHANIEGQTRDGAQEGQAWRALLTNWMSVSSMEVMMMMVSTCSHCLWLKKVTIDCTRQVQPDMSAAEPMDPPTFKPDVQITPSEEVPVGSKFLNMSDGAQAVGGRLGVRCVAGSIIASGQVTARSQGVWLNCDDEIIVNEELASAIAGSLNRETRNVCVCGLLQGTIIQSLPNK